MNKNELNLCIKPIEYLPCDICKNPVCNYKKCISPHVYCSLSCLEVIYIRLLNEIQHKTFETDDLMILNY